MNRKLSFKEFIYELKNDTELKELARYYVYYGLSIQKLYFFPFKIIEDMIEALPIYIEDKKKILDEMMILLKCNGSETNYDIIDFLVRIEMFRYKLSE